MVDSNWGIHLDSNESLKRSTSIYRDPITSSTFVVGSTQYHTEDGNLISDVRKLFDSSSSEASINKCFLAEVNKDGELSWWRTFGPASGQIKCTGRIYLNALYEICSTSKYSISKPLWLTDFAERL